MELLDGKLCSEQIRREIKEEVDAIKASGQRPPHLAAILVGDDGASQNQRHQHYGILIFEIRPAHGFDLRQ